MKMKILSLLLIIIAATGMISCAIDNNSKNQIQEKQIGEDGVETIAQPLIIKMTSGKEPIGVYEGTVTITGPGVEDICYEGIIMIQMDGDKVRIISTDSIRSEFNDLF